MQVLRSVGPWSLGRKIENSVEQAFVDAIAQAEKFIYIETHVSALTLTMCVICVVDTWRSSWTRERKFGATESVGKTHQSRHS